MEKMEEYLDQRILNTKQDLFDALFELLKTSCNIKVLDICKQANITPMTFYHHYGDKSQLMQDAINNQLSLRLPIPVKLRPGNLKQLIYYLIKFFSEFTLNNKNLFVGVYKTILLKGFKNSYLDIFSKTVNNYINKELCRLCNDIQPISINIWSDFLTYGFIGLFLKRTIINKNTEYETIKNNFNLLINKYYC